VRARRGLAVRWAAAVTIGVLVLALHGADAPAWLSAGPLSAPHTQLGACSDCHGSFDGGPVAWIHAALDADAGAADGDGALCLDCHELGDTPFNPHGVARSHLADLASSAAVDGSSIQPLAPEMAGMLFPTADAASGGVACANCHREHKGHDAVLTDMSNRRCQSCHSAKFTSLSDGHPDFGTYPYERRTHLNFDHVGHMRRHFPEADTADAPERCVDCHQAGDNGAHMEISGFEAACASCHAGEIRGENAAGSTGIPVITVPGLDVASLRESGAGIGAWPELSDRPLTPFMRTLFAADPALADALARYRALDPLDLRDAAPADIRAVTRIAWTTKELIGKLIRQGPEALRPELASAVGHSIDPAATRDLLGGMAYETIKEAQARWFPDLARELDMHQAGEDVPIPASEFGSADTAEGAASNTDDSGTGGQESILSDDDSAGDGDLLGGGAPDGDAGADQGDSGNILSSEPEGGDLLGGSGEQADDAGGGENILSDDTSAGGDLLGGDDEAGGGDILSGEPEGGDLMGGEAGGADTASSDEAADAAFAPPNPEEWGRLGGWYRDYFALLYRPGGHADRFLKAWLDLSGGAAAGSNRPGPAAIMKQLSAPDGPGKCTKCHSVDRMESGSLRVNWHGRRGRAGHQSFTAFAHAPHFTLLTDDQGCSTCHAFDPDADYGASFDDRDPTTYASNFRPIERATCSQCHVESQAGAGCTQCHNYHVGRVASAPNATRMETVEANSAVQ